MQRPNAYIKKSSVLKENYSKLFLKFQRSCKNAALPVDH